MSTDKNDYDGPASPDISRSPSPSPSSPPSSPLSHQQPQSQSQSAKGSIGGVDDLPKRFISSILGGDVPYGSRGHVLTRAERKDYSSPPIAPNPANEPRQFLSLPDKVTLPKPQAPPKTPYVEPPTRVSVIQRVPSQSQSTARKDGGKGVEVKLRPPEPEQVSSRPRHSRRKGGEEEERERERARGRRGFCY